jgi:hypothetical protein
MAEFVGTGSGSFLLDHVANNIVGRKCRRADVGQAGARCCSASERRSARPGAAHFPIAGATLPEATRPGCPKKWSEARAPTGKCGQDAPPGAGLRWSFRCRLSPTRGWGRNSRVRPGRAAGTRRERGTVSPRVVSTANQIRAYWWCRPPRIGRQRMRPTVSVGVISARLCATTNGCACRCNSQKLAALK